jgi:FkbM family methyltransferase
MISTLKRLIIGSPLEELARTIHGWLTLDRPARMNQQYDRQTRTIMGRVLKRTSNCVDVGCHQGWILDDMLRIAPDGTHFAFEPLPCLFRELERKYTGRARLSNLALSDSTGNTTFQHVVTNPAESGIKAIPHIRHEKSVEITVPLGRLDDIVDKPVDFIKIDVEGAELQVLRGGLKTLQKNKPYVVFEHGSRGANSYGATPEQVFDLFRDCAMHISLMADWLSGRPALSKKEFVSQFYQTKNFYFLAHH